MDWIKNDGWSHTHRLQVQSEVYWLISRRVFLCWLVSVHFRKYLREKKLVQISIYFKTHLYYVLKLNGKNLNKIPTFFKQQKKTFLGTKFKLIAVKYTRIYNKDFAKDNLNNCLCQLIRRYIFYMKKKHFVINLNMGFKFIVYTNVDVFKV